MFTCGFNCTEACFAADDYDRFTLSVVANTPRVTNNYIRGKGRSIFTLASLIAKHADYEGNVPLSAFVSRQGQLLFYYDGNKNAIPDSREVVCRLEVERARRRLIASDNYGGHRFISISGLEANWLWSMMLRRQRTHFGHYHVFGYRYYPRGYYRSLSWRRSVRADSVFWRRSTRFGFGK